MEISTDMVRFGGLVLMHTALIASAQCEGELICPFAVVAKDDNRQTIEFEAETQEEAVANGKASLDEYQDSVDFWSLAREGLYSATGEEGAKIDVLLVSVWEPGLDEPIEILQRFRPSAPGPFELLGTPEIFYEGYAQQDESADAMQLLLSEGIVNHPSGEKWATWVRQ